MAVTLAAIAVYFAHMGSLLQTAVAIIGFFTGPLLGMFLLGMLSTRATSVGANVGAIVGFISALLLWNQVSFIWYAVTGCVPTVLVGYAISLLTSPQTNDVLSMTVWGHRKPLPQPNQINSQEPEVVYSQKVESSAKADDIKALESMTSK